MNLKTIALYAMFFIMIIAILRPGSGGERGLYLNHYSIDEALWKVKSDDWLHSPDNKSPVFLLVNKLLGIDHTYFYTRLLNITLLFLCSYLIYSITRRRESFLFILLPIYMDAFVLLDTTFEVLFMLMAIKYNRFGGLWTGIAMIFRPYAIIYTVLLENRQKLILVTVGVIYALFLLATGGFWNYLQVTTAYAADTPSSGNYWTLGGVFLLSVFAFLGWQKDKTLFKYGLVACIPLLLRAWGHYFLPAVTFWFLSYLSEKRH